MEVPVLLGRLEEGVGAHDIVRCVLEGIVEGVVDVRLGGEMDDGVDRVFIQNVENQVLASDISLNEFVAGIGCDVRHVGAIIQTVDVHDVCRWIRLNNVIDEVRSDEPAATCDKNGGRHLCRGLYFSLCSNDKNDEVSRSC